MSRECGVARLAVVALVIACGCSRDASPPPAPAAPVDVLAAVPPWVAVGVGGIQHVNVSGGVPPYFVATEPDSIARVDIASADSTTAILKITGLITSSGGTQVVVKDHTPDAAKSVSIPVTVF